MDHPAIVHRPDAPCFETTLDGARGVLQYRLLAEAGRSARMLIPSVVVDPAIEGRGVASALTRAALDWARAEGLRVEPFCPYVQAWLGRHPEYGNLRVDEPPGEGVALVAAPAAALPFVVPCRSLPWHAPFGWLRRGWQDLARAPLLSAGFGLLIVLVSVGVAGLAWWLGRFALLAALLSGFVFVAPLIGVALYGVSRAHERGERPSFAASLLLARRAVGQAAVFALLQMVVLLLWSRAGMMVSAFVPIEDGSPGSLIEFLLLGSALGSVFAVFTFAVTAFSLPMVADREVDMVTAGISSVNAVLRNKPAAATWAALIAALTGLGLATAFVGLALLMPWLAYAAWHGYREALDASAWAPLP